MIDIATVPAQTTQKNPTAAFDWGVFAGAGYDQAWLDASNLCAGLIERTVHLNNSYALVLESGLHTAVIHSLFTDARAARDDPLPLNSTDRRGWLGAHYLPNADSATNDYGSRLWCRYYTKASEGGANMTLEQQRFATHEALGWLVRDGVIDALEVQAQYHTVGANTLLALHIVMHRAGQVSPVYDAVWGATLAHAEGYRAT